MTTKSSLPATSSLSGDRPSKTSKSTKIVRLRLSPTLLIRFSSKPSSRKDSKSKSSSSSTSTPAPVVVSASSTDNASETNSTPAPGVARSSQSPGDESKRKSIAGPNAGTKRGLGSGTDVMAKPRGKPGPKKKPKLENGGVENSIPTTKPWTTVAPLATHKLGPKANQGAINAGLRALDRTGKPCRKWERKGFKVKSFTGVTWQLPSWRTPKSTTLNVNDGSKEASTPRLDGDSKANNSSSAVDSEKSHSGGDLAMPTLANHTASSPIIGIAIPA
ncbi:MAG: hypothetical protein M1830_000227 [Pleopsidium flavum]|nr:MAG: hypothetical protein M1830_000227 [Pleopsidium flavum]